MNVRAHNRRLGLLGCLIACLMAGFLFALPARGCAETLASSEVSNPTSKLSLCTLGKSPRTWARAPGANLAGQPLAAVIDVSLI